MARSDDLLLYGGLGLVGLAGILWLGQAKAAPPAAPPPSGIGPSAGPGAGANPPTQCLVTAYDPGQPPAQEITAGQWLRAGKGWFPQPITGTSWTDPNMPFGWSAGQAGPQPQLGVANSYIWTGAGWIANPARRPLGWSAGTAQASPILCPTSLGTPPPEQAPNWMRTGVGWYPIPSNVPPGWVPGKVAPQPGGGATPQQFIWTASAWIPNPDSPPPGWTL